MIYLNTIKDTCKNDGSNRKNYAENRNNYTPKRNEVKIRKLFSRNKRQTNRRSAKSEAYPRYPEKDPG